MTDELGIFEVMYSCRAMRRIKPDPVPEDLLVKLIDAANQAPTASNAQNGRWIVVRDPEVRRQIADLNRAAIERSYGPLPADSDAAAARRRRAFMWQYSHMQDIPALIVACLQFATPRPNTFVSGVSAGGSIWPAVQNLLLAARALGLGAVPTTLPLADRPAFKAVLKIPENVEPFCLVPVGYPMGQFGPVTRLPVEQIMRWDRWE
jgi:nitroreductase